MEKWSHGGYVVNSISAKWWSWDIILQSLAPQPLPLHTIHYLPETLTPFHESLSRSKEWMAYTGHITATPIFRI